VRDIKVPPARAFFHDVYLVVVVVYLVVVVVYLVVVVVYLVVVVVYLRVAQFPLGRTHKCYPKSLIIILTTRGYVMRIP